MGAIEFAEAHIRQWAQSLSEPDPELGGFPKCPFAAKAKLELYFHTGEKFFRFAEQSIAVFHASREVGERVGIIVNVRKTVSNSTITTYRRQLNKDWMPRGIVLLEDHPFTTFKIGGRVATTNGEFPILLIQDLAILRQRAKELVKSGYYASWTDDNLKEVVDWRD